MSRPAQSRLELELTEEAEEVSETLPHAYTVKVLGVIITVKDRPAACKHSITRLINGDRYYNWTVYINCLRPLYSTDPRPISTVRNRILYRYACIYLKIKNRKQISFILYS